MQGVPRLQSDAYLHPQKRLLYAKIRKLMHDYGIVPSELLLSGYTARSLPEKHERRGICITCAAKEICQDANVEGGVWHCKKYR